MKDSFSKMHPLVNFTFFAAVILFSMFQMHPVCLAISLLCALTNAVMLGGKKTALFSLKFLLPTALLLMIINPLFNHQGVTIIEYLPWDNPLTFESIAYGVASAALLGSVVLWFSCVNRVMTSDKLVYLFGRISPALSLVLSMALRFIPRFTALFRQVRLAQRQISGCGKKTLTTRFKSGLKVLSIMISWSMENSIETADSMKGRGYGLKGRTAFALYRFNRYDIMTMSVMLLEITALTIITVFGKMKFRYFPSIRGNWFDIFSFIFYIIYALMMLTPLLINAKEGIGWKRLQSKI